MWQWTALNTNVHKTLVSVTTQSYLVLNGRCAVSEGVVFTSSQSPHTICGSCSLASTPSPCGWKPERKAGGPQAPTSPGQHKHLACGWETVGRHLDFIHEHRVHKMWHLWRLLSRRLSDSFLNDFIQSLVNELARRFWWGTHMSPLNSYS